MASTLRTSIGASFRTARLDRGWTQARLGTAAGVSRSMVAVIERGGAAASLETMDRLAHALEVDFQVELRVPVAVGRLDQADPAHAATVAAVRRWLERHGFRCVVECPIADGRIRGWIDLLAFDGATKRLVLVEAKTELRDLGGLQRQVDWYARAAPGAAARLGWRATEPVVLVVFLATAENDGRLDVNRDAIRHTFPLRGRALQAALRGKLPGRGIAMVDPRRRGSRIWIGLTLDDRRTAAPYASYADFMRTLPARRRAAASPRRQGRFQPA